MCRFPVFAGKILLFTIIFAFLAGNASFSEEIKLTTVIPEDRIVRGTIDSGIELGVLLDKVKAGFSVEKVLAGTYEIAFKPPFSATPTLACSYQELPGGDINPKVQIVDVNETNAIVVTVNLAGTTPMDTGSVTFIAIGPR